MSRLAKLPATWPLEMPPRRPANQGNRPATGPNIPRGRGEWSRHDALRGKCFRYAKSDHMIPQCSYPETVKCNTCGATGHITPACERWQNAQLTQHVRLPSSISPAQPSTQLAIAYDGGSSSSADGSSAWPLPFSVLASLWANE